MSNNEKSDREILIEVFLFEVTQLIEQLENFAIQIDNEKTMSQEAVNEIFRIMHTIKGSSSMMMFNSIAELTHKVEDLFSLIRDNKIKIEDCSKIIDILLATVDFVKEEIGFIENGDEPVGDPSEILILIKEFTNPVNTKKTVEPKPTNKKPQTEVQKVNKKSSPSDNIQNKSYTAMVVFEEDCMMENIRAFAVVHGLKNIASDVYWEPENLEGEDSAVLIRENGLIVYFNSDKSMSEIESFFKGIIMVKNYTIKDNDEEETEPEVNVAQINNDVEDIGNEIDSVDDKQDAEDKPNLEAKAETNNKALVQNKVNLISVNTNKLDTLMDLVGETVIVEAMITKSPDLAGLKLDNFNKIAMQLRKLTDEIKDVVMTLRMMPVSSTFQKMQRIVRDMNKRLNKQVTLILEGEETEVDKNIIENLSDPLMHIVRNSMDHGIESEDERIASGKPAQSRVKISAANSGGDVIIRVSDDGRGIDKDVILEKAQKKNLLKKSASEMSEKEIFNLLFLPGFSTKAEASEFSGRGVGMDVVKQNIEKISGSTYIDSVKGQGTTITIKIPLTLAIIEGMGITIGNSIFTIPIASIRESFRPKKKEIIKDTDGNEMIIIRGVCYPVIRLHKMFGIEPKITDFDKGIILLVENDDKAICLFADQLIGEQQVVIKPLPKYIKKYIKKSIGISGCTILGDGNLSLILNVPIIINSTI